MGRAYDCGGSGQKEEADGQPPEDEPDFRGGFEFVWNLCFYTGDSNMKYIIRGADNSEKILYFTMPYCDCFFHGGVRKE